MSAGFFDNDSRRASTRNVVLLAGGAAETETTRHKVFAVELSILVHSVMIGLTYLQDLQKLLLLSVRASLVLALGPHAQVLTMHAPCGEQVALAFHQALEASLLA